jgi:acetaldehyde dehydrogenase/alcohol dehydrogenase
VADFVGLEGSNTADKVNSLIEAIIELLNTCNMPTRIKDVGISEKDLKDALPDLIDKAFDDPSTRSNPRFPMVDEIEELFHLAYEGRL